MPPIESNGNLEKLKQYYRSSDAARLLLDYFSKRQRGPEVIVDCLEKIRLEGDTRLARRDIIDVLKQLDSLGYGDFIIGRRNGRSRLQWKVSMPSVGKAAKGQGPIETITGHEEAEDHAVTLNHIFKLRPDYEVTVTLPVDFNSLEASRLADFVKTLPFHEARNAQ